MALHTITSQPDLFKIVTTINVERLYELLSMHPNHALVDSICLSLRNGVWPFVNIDPLAPETFDGSQRLLNKNSTQFTLEQQDIEIGLGCYSVAFGPDLLPRMFSPPIDAICYVL